MGWFGEVGWGARNVQADGHVPRNCLNNAIKKHRAVNAPTSSVVNVVRPQVCLRFTYAHPPTCTPTEEAIDLDMGMRINRINMAIRVIRIKIIWVISFIMIVRLVRLIMVSIFIGIITVITVIRII